MSQTLLWPSSVCWRISIVYPHLWPLFWTHFMCPASYSTSPLRCPIDIQNWIYVFITASPAPYLFISHCFLSYHHLSSYSHEKLKISFWHFSHIISYNQLPRPVYPHPLIPLLHKSKAPSPLSEYWNGFLTFFQLHSFIPSIHVPHGNQRVLS